MATLSLPKFFPPPSLAPAMGLVQIGGDLSTQRLLDAYRHGIFPWPIDGGLLAWWSPDPRAVLEFADFHVPRRLARTMASKKFRVTSNRDFAGVIRGCASAPGRRGATWITSPMISAYTRLHELGHAHSIEVWSGDALAGGTYGVALGGLFAAESMFFSVRDASKVALVHLVGRLQARGYELLDIQMLTPHTQRFGAREIPRHAYLQRLAAAVAKPVSFLHASEAL